MAAVLFFAPQGLTQQNGPLKPTPSSQRASGIGQKDQLAEEVVKVLRENPPLLLEAKSQIAAELNRRGFPVGEVELSDARVFTQIRTNPDLRDLVANSLQARGFLDADSFRQGTKEADAEEEEPRDAREEGAKGRDEADEKGRKGPGAKGTEKPRPPQGLMARPNPYKDVPALADLYRQFAVSTATPERFGAELFKQRTPGGTPTSVLEMPIGSDYVLGPGDGLVIEMRGAYSQRLMRTVDHEGRISIPETGNILVAGSTLALAQENVQRAARQQFRDVEVELSLNRLRRVRVYVVGDVERPGAYDVSSLSTVLSALLAAGGPTDLGSLRTVKHMRGGKLLRVVDLYGLMLQGHQGASEALHSGDTLLVPPTGPQVTLVGMVRRPAIYELRSEQKLRDVLALAGGVLVAGELSNIKVERVKAHQGREMLNLRLDPADPLGPSDGAGEFVVHDGDVVTIAPILPYSDKVVYLQGHVFRPGKYPFREGMTLLDVVPDFQQLLPEPADKAELIRLRPPDFRPSVLSVDVRAILEKREPPVKLEPFDTLRFAGRYENDAPTVSIFGEVLRPGEYPLSDRMTAADLVRMAGGFKRSAYLKSADLSSYLVDGEKVSLDHREVAIGEAVAGAEDTDVRLKAGDVLTIRQLGQWSEIGGSIDVRGAVLYPGRYGVQQGERLSAVLKRAGGFLDDAYPVGAVLERAQVREIATKSRDQLIQRLESQGADLSRDPAGAAGVAQQRQRLIERLKSTVPSGRLVIRIEPSISAWENTSADIEIRPGDSLYIPKKPNFVLVDGQVYSPSAITFTPGKNAGWYLKQAGGPTEFANRKDIFIVRANGSVIGRDSRSWWVGGVLSHRLNPGDTLVVPEKVVSGSLFWRDLAQSAQVVSAIAIAARVATSF